MPSIVPWEKITHAPHLYTPAIPDHLQRLYGGKILGQSKVDVIPIYKPFAAVGNKKPKIITPRKNRRSFHNEDSDRQRSLIEGICSSQKRMTITNNTRKNGRNLQEKKRQLMDNDLHSSTSAGRIAISKRYNMLQKTAGYYHGSTTVQHGVAHEFVGPCVCVL